MQAEQADHTKSFLLQNSHLALLCLFIEHSPDVSKAKAHTAGYGLATIATVEQAIHAAHNPGARPKLSLRAVEVVVDMKHGTQVIIA